MVCEIESMVSIYTKKQDSELGWSAYKNYLINLLFKTYSFTDVNTKFSTLDHINTVINIPNLK